MPVRKVRLKDGSIGYQWGTTGKIYKRKEDAERQGWAILLSKRKKKMNKLYDEMKNKLDALEKALNGGKGSGNFGHTGRPGEVGGSGSGKGTSKSKTLADYEDAYYAMYDKVGLDTLSGELYDAGNPSLDDVRYALDSITSQYSAMIHGETFDDKVNKEYSKNIKDETKYIRKTLKQIDGYEELKNRVLDVLEFLEENPYENSRDE